ncbi:STAS domain-containing protein [Actinoplanes sp. NPDC026619]|uniref:STAS domain-containing protein n=1 Tax=Actinoplanes sp. NPDC026619 TaxID=3155798 RepID=UPI0033D91097
MQLICDNCGVATVTDGGGLHDAELVYVAVTDVGWTGSPFARGLHRCPGCSAEMRVTRPVPERSPGSAAVLDRIRVAHLTAASLVQIDIDIDMDLAAELRAALEIAVTAHRNVIVDLSGAGVIDSVGLGVLVRARNIARQRPGEVVLAAPSRFIQTVLRTMRLHTAFRTFDTVEGAIMATNGCG